jgi:tRNA nucleotidyltransferase (CCA-adding enzyme)
MIEENTYNWINKTASAIRSISTERIRDELQKMLLSEAPVRSINLLLNSGLLELIIPELLPTIGQKQNKYHVDSVFGHTMMVLSAVPPVIELRLAALLHDIAKPLCVTEDEEGCHFYDHEKIGAELASRILHRLKFSVKTQKLVKSLVKDHMILKQAGTKGEEISDKKLRKLILNWGDDLELLFELVHADNLAHAPNYVLKQQISGLRKRVEHLKKGLTKEEMPVKGKDIIDFFKLAPGKQIREYLNESQEIWLQHPDWDKDRILRYLKFKEEENGRRK